MTADYGEHPDQATIDWLMQHTDVWCPTCGWTVAPARYPAHAAQHQAEARATATEADRFLRGAK